LLKKKQLTHSQSQIEVNISFAQHTQLPHYIYVQLYICCVKFALILHRVNYENLALYFCLYLCQLLTDFQNFFTGTLCRQFAILCIIIYPTTP